MKGLHPHRPGEGWQSITNHRHAADLRVCGCLRSSALSCMPFFSLKSLRLQISHIFQVTSTVPKAGRGGEEGEGGGGDLDPALSTGERSGPVPVRAFTPFPRPGAAGRRWPRPEQHHRPRRKGCQKQRRHL